MYSIQTNINAHRAIQRETPTRSGRRREYSDNAVKGCRQTSRPADLCRFGAKTGAAGFIYIEGCLSLEAAAATPAGFTRSHICGERQPQPGNGQGLVACLRGVITKHPKIENRDRFVMDAHVYPGTTAV